jgi:hypothetical protein
MDFNTLNNNLNEYNLVRECIKFVGKETIDEQYERIKHELEDEEIYQTEHFSYEFLRNYSDELNYENFLSNLDSIIENSKMNKKDYIEKYKPFLHEIFNNIDNLCMICLDCDIEEHCEICCKGYCSKCIDVTGCIREDCDKYDKYYNECENCYIKNNLEIHMKYDLDKLREEDRKRKEKERKRREEEIKRKNDRNKKIITNMLKSLKKKDIKTYIENKKNKYKINFNKTKKDIIDIISDKYDYNDIIDILNY